MNLDIEHERICGDIATSKYPEIIRLKQRVTGLVPGDGNLHRPKLILVGEAPGRQEDLQGKPFVGASGRFLDELLGIAGLKRKEVWITNVVKYRPPKNRDPEPEEIDAFLPFLRRELRLAGHNGQRNIVGLGRIACIALASGNNAPFSVLQQRGSWVPLGGQWRLFVSLHPANGVRYQLRRKMLKEDFAKLGRDISDTIRP